MKIIVGDYDNEQINSGALLHTINATLVNINDESRLGGVDHFMCCSIRTIVSRYVSRLKRDGCYGYAGAKYNIVIEMRRGINPGPAERTVTIPIRCE